MLGLGFNYNTIHLLINRSMTKSTIQHNAETETQITAEQGFTDT